MSHEPHYVYIIGMPGQAISKVGISNRPAKRLKQLRTGSPFKLFLAFEFETPAKWVARELEAAFHKVLRRERMNGEWFSIDVEQAMRFMAINLATALRLKAELNDDEIRVVMLNSGFSEAACDFAILREGTVN